MPLGFVIGEFAATSARKSLRKKRKDSIQGVERK